MSKTPSKTVLPPLLILLLFQFSYANEAETEALLSLKASITDPLGFLSNWVPSSSTHCDWHGIECDDSSRTSKIDLSNGNLCGYIPIEVFSPSFLSLRHLNLSNNNFSGPIPAGSVGGLRILDLSNNALSGEIPNHIGSFQSLRSLDLGGNLFRGSIPIELTSLESLEELTLASNRLTGPIPTSIGGLKSLKWVYLGYNALSGGIPSEIGNLTSLTHLDLVYNSLSGGIPPSVANLEALNHVFLFGNRLSGRIPPVVFRRLRNLVSLDLSDNQLSGPIPNNLTGLGNLEILHLFGNRLVGAVPESVASLPRLRVLQLWSNSISGRIPSRLGQRGRLELIDLSTNNLTGAIPESLCDSGVLSKLILFSNSLNGPIPRQLGQCASLRRVRLEQNHLSGELPPGLTELRRVYYLDVSDNCLSGRIDGLQWLMRALQTLNFARNWFSGGLPESFGGENLEALDGSGNSLSGTIPGRFGLLSHLVRLNLSQNSLSGPVPGQLGRLKSLDLSQNAGLCRRSGYTGGLPPCPGFKSRRILVSAIVAVVSLSVLVVLLFVGWRRRRRSPMIEYKAGDWELRVFDGRAMEAIDVDAMVRAGSRGLSFFVRELSEIDESKALELARFHHRNAMDLIGVCSSHEKASYALYAFIEGRSLRSALNGGGFQDWAKRWCVAMGMAQVLELLHRRRNGFYGCVSSENVYLDGQGEPRLRVDLPGAVGYGGKGGGKEGGYLPPEIKDNKGYTEKSDVYAFGVLLVELVTGRHSDDVEDHHPHHNRRPGCESHDEVAKVLDLAGRCTAVDPSDRPSMGQVVKALKGIEKRGMKMLLSV